MSKVVKVQDAKAHLPQLLAFAEAGEGIVIGRPQRPVVRQVPADRPGSRTFGTMRSMVIPEDFDAPLPADELAAWDE